MPRQQFSVILPSEGVLYEDKLPNGKVNLLSLTANEEAILYAPGGDMTQKLNNVINGCIDNCPMPSIKLLSADRFYLLLALRTRSFGPEYEFQTKCPSCSLQYRTKINIVEDMEIKELVDDLEEPVRVQLPVSGDDLELKFLRGEDENKVTSYTKRARMSKVQSADPSFLYRMAVMVQNINGDALDEPFKVKYVREMDIGDSVHLRREIERLEPGIDSKLFLECSQCSFVNETTMPFTSDFLYPKKVSTASTI